MHSVTESSEGLLLSGVAKSFENVINLPKSVQYPQGALG
ncbi:hypothetical protein GAGA_4375 [Paraglaciecola agarilytica NO2]|uniref:Uncharacterized protein n=1 Tax=Paraglaciecola agarilytica NO2 TaxID=1125747 RepID=A0ABQ0ICZ6_9ALTE|nr:hypothetical protein GAGA_4375 [Paraglaciecola agarilytica NO2]